MRIVTFTFLAVFALVAFSFASEVPYAADLRAQGDKSFAAGEFDAAMKSFLEAAKLEPAFPGGQYRIAQTALRLKQPKVGLEALDAIAALDAKLATNSALTNLRKELDAIQAVSSEHAAEQPATPKEKPVESSAGATLERIANCALEEMNGHPFMIGAWIEPLIAAKRLDAARRTALLFEQNNGYRLLASDSTYEGRWSATQLICLEISLSDPRVLDHIKLVLPTEDRRIIPILVRCLVENNRRADAIKLLDTNPGSEDALFGSMGERSYAGLFDEVMTKRMEVAADAEGTKGDNSDRKKAYRILAVADAYSRLGQIERAKKLIERAAGMLISQSKDLSAVFASNCALAESYARAGDLVQSNHYLDLLKPPLMADYPKDPWILEDFLKPEAAAAYAAAGQLDKAEAVLPSNTLSTGFKHEAFHAVISTYYRKHDLAGAGRVAQRYAKLQSSGHCAVEMQLMYGDLRGAESTASLLTEEKEMSLAREDVAIVAHPEDAEQIIAFAQRRTAGKDRAEFYLAAAHLLFPPRGWDDNSFFGE